MSKTTSETICTNTTLAEFECEVINYDTSSSTKPLRANHKRAVKRTNRRKSAAKRNRRR